jgi:hypothetical protein
MKPAMIALVLVVAQGVAGPAPALAHEGDAESRAMRLHGLLMQLDRAWGAAQAESDAGKRAALLDTHGRTLLAVQESLHDAAEKSPCVMMEGGDAGRQLACLVDTEARLRATERVLTHVINRTATGP